MKPILSRIVREQKNQHIRLAWGTSVMKKFLNLVRFCVFCLLVSTAIAQRLPFKNYTTADGLPGPVVRDIAQDKYGYIWINTDGGVAQFDGVTFRNYTAEDSLSYIFCDSVGHVYLSGPDGLYRMAGDERVFYPSKRILGPVQRMLLDGDKTLWFWHQRDQRDSTKYAGLSKIVHDHLEAYPDTLLKPPAEGNIAGFVDDDEGNFWVRFWNMKSGKNTWHRFANGKFTKGMGAYGIAEDWDIWDFKVDRYGNCWFFRNQDVGNQRQLITYKFAKGRLVEYSDRKNGFHFNEGLLDGERNLWLIVHSPHQADNSYRGLGVARATEDTLEWFTEKQGLPNDKVRAIILGKPGTLWFVTWEGVSKYQAGKFQNITQNLDWPEALEGWDVFEDSRDNVWFAWNRNPPKREVGITLYAKGKMINYTLKHGIAGNFWLSQRSFGTDRGTVFWEDGDGNIWLQSDKALYCISESKLLRYDQKNGLAGPPPSVFDGAAFLQDRERNFWIGTQNGLSKLADRSYERYTTEDGLTSNMVTSPCQDQRGHLWMRADGQLHFMKDNRIEKFTLATDAPFKFYEDKAGNIWLSSPDGISKYDGTQLQVLNLPREDRVHPIFQDDLGNVWLAGYGVASKFDGKDFQYYTTQDSLIQGSIDGIFQDWRGHLWFVTFNWPFTRGGISKFDGIKFRNYTTENGELDPDGWSCSIDQRKHVWLSQKGVLRDLTDPAAPARKVPPVTRTNTTTDLFERIFYSVSGTKSFWDGEGNYWLGTDNGLVKIGQRDSQIFTTQDGLPGNKISGIAQDSLGNIWVGTNKGIGVYDSKRFRDYTYAHDLEPMTIKGDPIVDRSGNVWFGSVAGLIKVNSARAFERSAPPLLYLKSIQIDNVPILPRENLELDHTRNNLTFSYIGLCFKNEKAIRYQYFLDGYDKDWSGLTDKREVRYTNLDPGSYVFKVKAISGAGVESEIASVVFSISPPFWKTWWFIALSSLSTLLVGYIVYRRRVNAKLEKARILNELKAAHDMQMGLMPKCDPAIPGFDISGICKPAEEVGGDYFDYVWLDEEKTKFGIAIVDVSGKAMKGAMTAVMTSGMLYSEIGNSHSPRAILQKINKPMYLKTDRQIFTAMSLAVIDTQSKTLTFSSAGQTQPVLKRNEEIQYITVEGMHLPLGVKQEVEYGEVTVQLQPDDLVIFYTDGIPEAMNERNELFDIERLETTVHHLPPSARAAEVIEGLLQAVRQFSAKAEQHDDMTVVAVKVAH